MMLEEFTYFITHPLHKKFMIKQGLGEFFFHLYMISRGFQLRSGYVHDE
jgi:hypothetical protein